MPVLGENPVIGGQLDRANYVATQRPSAPKAGEAGTARKPAATRLLGTVGSMENPGRSVIDRPQFREPRRRVARDWNL